ncbi:chemotaxis protein CheW [Clostridium bornimense]|uniref:chemotaxis protein CheW n=1 Tax=Clostridium bornimense TaxID=1216932 RepID=UPI001C11BF98|nr:chemotaxis protein CheW [Clostridium bornimense]MBU5314685.1 chemotaxis protein CheW [Clostridium bornimense]
MSSKEMKILIFLINDEYFGIDIMEVERILSFSPLTEIPDSPNFVEGVINYEGSILPIINLKKKFSMKNLVGNNEDETKIIVSKQEQCKYGVMVDLVSEVKDISMDIVEETPEIVKGISERYIKGLIKLDDRIVILLNLCTILTDDEKKLL